MAKDIASLIAIGMGPRAGSAKGSKPAQRKHSVYVPPVRIDEETDSDPDDDMDDDTYPDTDTDDDMGMGYGHDDGHGPDDEGSDSDSPSPDQVDCAHDAIKALRTGDAKGFAEAVLAITGR